MNNKLQLYAKLESFVKFSCQTKSLKKILAVSV